MPTTLHTTQLGGESGPLGGRAPLVETMELMEPLKEMKPPDHLVESKIYSTVGRTQEIEAVPSALHFAGFELGVIKCLNLRLLNVSGDVQKMHVVPPQTKYFKIKYKKRERMVAGMDLECTVEFCPDEWRYYYDSIKVHCPGDENLIIPVHAYPVMSTDDFPEYMTFSNTAVGSKQVKNIPLKSTAPIDFEFQLNCIQPHSAFVVEPMSGVVPASGEVQISITYSPVEFSTALMRLQLTISQFNSQPLVCTVIGRSTPGLQRDEAKAQLLQEENDEVLDPRSLSAVERARSKRKQRHIAQPKPAPVEEIDVDGLKIPVKLDCPWAVSQVLNQEPGKMRAKELREAKAKGVLQSTKTPEEGASSRQAKTAKFEAAVRRDVYEERQNQLRWQVKVGEDPVSGPRRLRVMEKRAQGWHEYKLKRGDPVLEVEAVRRQNELISRRTRRDKDKLGAQGMQFDTYSNDPWQRRNMFSQKFIFAARTIVIRVRAERYLRSLRQVLTLVKQGMPTAHAANLVGKQHQSSVEVGDSKDDLLKEEEEEEEEVESASRGPPKPLHLLKRSHVTTASFPTYVAPNAKDDMAADALGQVPYTPSCVEFRRRVPYYGLHVPQTYKLLGYRKLSVHDAGQGYVSPKLTRELRTGAEDEVIRIPPLPLGALSPRAEDLDPAELAASSRQPSDTRPLPLPLAAPEVMLQATSYPPLHIFNPSPGLQVFLPPLPYAETNSDFHLCPLPRYTVSDVKVPHAATQKRYLDREDTIRGVMQWKKLPSQGLSCLANTPTLTAVWVPRWSDPFQSSLLPVNTPQLQTGLSAQDEQNLTPSQSEEEGAVLNLTLTPEMVAAQFAMTEKIDSNLSLDQAGKDPNTHEYFPYGSRMPSTNLPVGPAGPVPRERREQELDWFIKRKSNRLGAKIHSRVEALNDCKSDPNLVLR